MNFHIKSSNNVVSHSKKAVMSALVESFGAVGGIFTSAVFRQEDFPRYIPGIYVSIACQILLLLLLAGTTMHFWSQNSKARIGTSVILEGRPGFQYTI